MAEDPHQLTLPGTPEVWSVGNGCYRAFIPFDFAQDRPFDFAQDRQDRRVLRALLRIPGVELAGSYFADAGRPHGWQVEFPRGVLGEVGGEL